MPDYVGLPTIKQIEHNQILFIISLYMRINTSVENMPISPKRLANTD